MGIEFVLPSMLWWLALPAGLLLAYAVAQTRRAPHAVRFSNLGLIRTALGERTSTAGRRHVPAALVGLMLLVGVTALARPAVRVGVPKERVTIVLVIDVSGSMSANDMLPSRLSAAKRAGKTFVESLPSGFRVGVVSFSSDATLVQPVTEDLPAVRAAIDDLQLGGGTAIGEGIQVALAALPPDEALLAGGSIIAPRAPNSPPPPPPGIILLLTDGANTEGMPPLDAAAKARAANVPIFTVGMGGRSNPFGFGRARSGVDEDNLREIAAQTGGQYYYAPGGGELQRVYNDLGLAMGWDFERREIGGYVASAGLAATLVAFTLSFLWLHRQP